MAEKKKIRKTERMPDVPETFYEIWETTMARQGVMEKLVKQHPAFAESFGGKGEKVRKTCHNKRESARKTRKKIELLRGEEWVPASQATEEEKKAQQDKLDALVGAVFADLFTIWIQLDMFDQVVDRVKLAA